MKITFIMTRALEEFTSQHYQKMQNKLKHLSPKIKIQSIFQFLSNDTKLDELNIYYL